MDVTLNIKRFDPSVPEPESYWQSFSVSIEDNGTVLDALIKIREDIDADLPGVTFGLHLCRGNQQSRWLVEGGYEAIAAPIFRRVRAGRLLLEYDDARSAECPFLFLLLDF